MNVLVENYYELKTAEMTLETQLNSLTAKHAKSLYGKYAMSSEYFNRVYVTVRGDDVEVEFTHDYSSDTIICFNLEEYVKVLQSFEGGYYK